MLHIAYRLLLVLAPSVAALTSWASRDMQQYITKLLQQGRLDGPSIRGNQRAPVELTPASHETLVLLRVVAVQCNRVLERHDQT